MQKRSTLRRRRALIVAPLAAAAFTMGALALQPFANAGGGALQYYPDLRADPAENISSPSIVSNPYAGANRLIVRFDGWVTNIGGGPLRIQGNPQPGGGIAQKVRTSAGGSATLPVATPEVKFESADGHNHFHLMRVMRYSLWNEDRTAEAAPAGKVGFCLYDSALAPNPTTVDAQNWTVGAAGDTFCQSPGDGGAGPGATSLDMGVSAGWRDLYDQSLTFQWVDVTNTAPGLYWVASQADPDDVIRESNEVNPIAFANTPVTVPGYAPQPVGATVGYQKPQSITLASQAFGGVSSVSYRIETLPKNGTLNVTTGQDLANPVVVYTPNPGYGGPDSFTYSAQDTASSFPATRATAAVTLSVGADPSTAVGISGAPGAMFAGNGVKLSAQVIGNPNKSVRWTVNGKPGGSAATGTINAAGLYLAPARVPAGGRVTIRATSAASPSRFDEAVIRIRKPPNGLPLPGGAVNGRKGVFPTPGLWVKKRQLQLATFSRRAGVVQIKLFNGKKRIRTCTAKVRAGQGYVCNQRMKSGYKKKQLRAVATLKTSGKKKLTRIVGPTSIGAVAISKKGTSRKVKIKPLRSGRLTVVVTDGRGRLARCNAKVLARQAATCKFRYRGSKVTATAVLKAYDGLKTTRRKRS